MARALGRISRPESVAPLTTALAADNAQVQVAALRALQSIAGLRDGRAVAPLIADGDVAVRAEAATTLGMFRDRSGTGALVTALQNDPSVTVRKRAAWALGAMGASSAEAGPGAAERRANDASPLVRSLAASGADQADVAR